MFRTHINLFLSLLYINTGVKFVHHTAAKYDIGVYFEANGHGTALIKGHVVEQLKTIQATDKRSMLAVERLLALHQLINQAVRMYISYLFCMCCYICMYI